MWKTRLRCALNKASDIQEVKQKHDLQCDKPFKVYRFISKSESSWRANASRNASLVFDGVALTPSTSCFFPVHNTTFAKPILVAQHSDTVHSIDLMNNTLHRDILTPSTTSNSNAVTNNSSGFPFHSHLGSFKRIVQSNTNSHPTCTSDTSAYLSDVLEPELHQLAVRILHLDKRAKDHIITNPTGCCIYYGRCNDSLNSQVHVVVPDPVEAQILPLVADCNRFYVDLLLDNMSLGVNLFTRNGSLYAQRLCKCAVFVYLQPASSDIDDDRPLSSFRKLRRLETVQLFNYDAFMANLAAYKSADRSPPRVEVVLGFGQQLRRSAKVDQLLVWARVASCRAWYQLQKVITSSGSRQSHPSTLVEGQDVAPTSSLRTKRTAYLPANSSLSSMPNSTSSTQSCATLGSSFDGDEQVIIEEGVEVVL